MIRGGGPGALSTLSPFNGKILRPLVFFTREEISIVVKELGYKVFEDETNQSDQYTRNRIRHTILPLLKNEGLNSYKLYWNFHENAFLTGQSQRKQRIRIHSELFESLSLFDKKHLLDSHLKILRLHPISRSILEEIQRCQEMNSVIDIQTGELRYWKSPGSDLYLFPNYSEYLQPPKWNGGRIEWIQKSRELQPGESLGSFLEYPKIKVGAMYKDISEILRSEGVPTPIRKNIPLIIQNHSVRKILLSFWDDRKKDYPKI